jgi:flagellar motor switch protein FliG
VVADILNLTGSSVEKNVLDQMDAQDPEVADEELKDEILGNMSERVRTFISEEMEFLGPMRLSEVEEVQLRIVQQVRQLEEQG